MSIKLTAVTVGCQSADPLYIYAPDSVLVIAANLASHCSITLVAKQICVEYGIVLKSARVAIYFTASDLSSTYLTEIEQQRERYLTDCFAVEYLCPIKTATYTRSHSRSLDGGLEDFEFPLTSTQLSEILYLANE